MYIVNHAKQFLLGGVAIIVTSILALVIFGLNLGIDFTGGALTEVAYDVRPDKAQIENSLVALDDKIDLGGYSLRESVSESEEDGFILRTRDLKETERQQVESLLLSHGENPAVSRFTSIGPVIGEELKDKAVWAIGLVVLIIVSYIAIAFRGISKPVRASRYGYITILALAHDVLVPTAFFGILGYAIGAEVDVLFVMAILAVLGYSVNDTIVVFDRVRENLLINKELEKHEPFKDVVGRSLSQTYVRSINTSVTTFLALLALYFLGGDVTQNFALVLMAGVVAGTYSSLFIACPFLVKLEERQREKLGKVKKEENQT